LSGAFLLWRITIACDDKISTDGTACLRAENFAKTRGVDFPFWR
jgi:hypothetical protein